MHSRLVRFTLWLLYPPGKESAVPTRKNAKCPPEPIVPTAKLIFFLSFFLSFFLNRPLLPCGVEGFLLVNLVDNW
jgi:hypothetical protein